MKRLLLPAALLCLLAACAAPETQETSASLPEPAPDIPECRETANEVISPAAETALRTLLAEAASQSERRATAGDSMRLCALAGMLLDWQREANPAPSAAEAAAHSYASELDAQTRKALENRLGALRAAASELCAGNTDAMEDGGYVPRCPPWEASAAEAFFAALLRGVKSEYSDDGSGKMNSFPLHAVHLLGGRDRCASMPTAICPSSDRREPERRIWRRLSAIPAAGTG